VKALAMAVRRRSERAAGSGLKQSMLNVGMDRKKLEAQLIQAQKRVSLGEKHLMRQKKFVLGLERLGNNADAARAVLEKYERIQAMQVERYELLLEEVNKLSS
jgi:hypothetical protein